METTREATDNRILQCEFTTGQSLPAHSQPHIYTATPNSTLICLKNTFIEYISRTCLNIYYILKLYKMLLKVISLVAALHCCRSVHWPGEKCIVIIKFIYYQCLNIYVHVFGWYTSRCTYFVSRWMHLFGIRVPVLPPCKRLRIIPCWLPMTGCADSCIKYRI